MKRLKVFHSRPQQIAKRRKKRKKPEKCKEGIFESKNPQRVSQARKKPKKEILAEKRYTDPVIAAQLLLAQSLLGAAGALGAAQVNPILAALGTLLTL